MQELQQIVQTNLINFNYWLQNMKHTNTSDWLNLNVEVIKELKNQSLRDLTKTGADA